MGGSSQPYNEGGELQIKDNSNRKIAGKEIETVGKGGVKDGGGFSGGDVAIFTGVNPIAVTTILKNGVEGNNDNNLGSSKITEHGLYVLDLKRRRVEENITDGLGPEGKQLDNMLLDSHETDEQNQKNGEEAGVAMQPRLGL